MNIFGAFTFGSLIKTFLPGFVWLLALVVLTTEVQQFCGVTETLWAQARTKDQAAILLSIPASILLGLLSNIIVFMGLNDRLVRLPVRAANKDLCALYDTLAERMRDRYWKALENVDPSLQATFKSQIDPELILLHSEGVEKLVYVREQYWFHLEFQLNLTLSIFAVAVATVIWSLASAPAPWNVAGALGSAALGALVMRGLVLAARKNYSRHLAKIATIMVVALYQPPPAEPAV